jgi:hypothetical protein
MAEEWWSACSTLGLVLEHWDEYRWVQHQSWLAPFLGEEVIRLAMKLTSGLIAGQLTRRG